MSKKLRRIVRIGFPTLWVTIQMWVHKGKELEHHDKLVENDSQEKNVSLKIKQSGACSVSRTYAMSNGEKKQVRL